MSNRDARGLEMSGASERAMAAYETALTEFRRYSGDPVATIDAVLAEEPDFIMGHLLRAQVLATLGEAQFLPVIAEAVDNAEGLAAGANERELALTAAARCWLCGDWNEAVRRWDRVLADHPRDQLTLQTAHLADFLRGDSVNLRDRVARVLPAWDHTVPGYSYVLGMYAFGLEECNQFEDAEDTARHALHLERRDPWAVHALAHVMEMIGRHDDGVEMYREREADWAPDCAFAYHNWWHLALFHIERGEDRRALALFDEHISPEPADEAMALLDATALLWRLVLLDVDVGNRFEPLADKWAEKMGLESGYYAFNDMHAMIALIGCGRLAEAKGLAAGVERAAHQDFGTGAMMAREVGVPVARGMVAFGEARYREAAEQLCSVRAGANRFGGSNAQRDLLAQTALAAAIRGGDEGRARALIGERVAHKPESPLARRYHQQLMMRREADRLAAA